MVGIPRLHTMSDHNVRMMSAGPPETILPEPPASLIDALASIGALTFSLQRAALLDVVARHPAIPHAWAALGAASAPGTEAYMAYRVGYHRGLDLLRANGWRGSGFVPTRRIVGFSTVSPGSLVRLHISAKPPRRSAARNFSHNSILPPFPSSDGR